MIDQGRRIAGAAPPAPPAAWSGARGGAARLALAWPLVLALVLAAPPARALDPASSLRQLNHFAWRERDGAPPDVTALAQTRDGYLWLGTPTGLLRFDGVHFERYQPAGGQALLSVRIRGLITDRQGRLWICYYFGGASMLDESGRITHFRPGQGLPAGTLRELAQRADGSVWAATTKGLYRYDGRRWALVDVGQHQAPRSVALDARGVLWIGAPDAVHFVRPGSQQLEYFAVDPRVLGPAVRVMAGKSLWLRGATGLTEYALNDSFRPTPLVTLTLAMPNNVFLREQSGGLLLAYKNGLGHVGARQLGQRDGALAPDVDLYTELDGMSGQGVQSLLEDREGNVWVGTNGGLDRFRDNRFRMPAGDAPSSGEFGIDASDRDNVWVSAVGIGLRRLGRRPRAFPAVGDDIMALTKGRDGAIDVASFTRGLWHIDGDTATRLPAPPVPLSEAYPVQALLRDRRGRLWLSQVGVGIFRLQDGVWQGDPQPGLFPGPAITLQQDADGAIWFGYPGNRLARLQDETVRRYDAADGLAVGDVLAVSSQAGQLWVGGDMGVACLLGARFGMLGGRQAAAFAGTSGIVRSADGALWLNGGAGLLRIPGEQLADFQAGRAGAAPPQFERFDYHDGADGAVGQLGPLPTASLSDDGQLWFATNRKVVAIDPLQIRRNRLPPTVRISAIHASGVAYAATPAAAVRLPQYTRSLDIAYTALALSVPERVKFRYRLEGVDQKWVEADTRRIAYYTNLAPGRYRFHLLAANEDGVWNQRGATQEIEIAPAYHQSAWFHLLLGAAALAGLWALYATRQRLLAARREGRLAERERIARELHDTLLQSTQGLIYGFHAASKGVPPNSPARVAMGELLARAEEALKEIRDRVQGLRAGAGQAAPGQVRSDDAQLVAHILAGLPEAQAAPIHVTVHGAHQALRAAVVEEVCGIAREALLNALRHSAAQNIHLTLEYGCGHFEVVVRDDGVGIPAAILARGAKSGHWGLVGMHERARRIRGSLSITSAAGGAGKGSRIVLRLPAAAAYAARRCAGRPGWLARRCRWHRGV